MKNYILDVETLGIESTSIVLSIALVPFEIAGDELPTFQDLCSNAHFFKLSQKDQINKGRGSCDDTIAWWSRQSKEAQKTSYTPSNADLDPEYALAEIRSIVDPKKDILWQRGSLDQVVMDSLCRTYNQKPI